MIKKIQKILIIVIVGIFIAGVANAYLSQWWKTVDSIIPRTADTVDLGGVGKEVRAIYTSALTTDSLSVNGAFLTVVSSNLYINPSSAQTYFTGGGNTHAVRVCDNNNVTKVMLNGGGDSYFTGGQLGIGVTDPDAELEIFGTGIQLKLSYDAGNYSELTTDSAGDLWFWVAGGDIEFRNENLTTSGAGTFGSLITDSFTDGTLTITGGDITGVDDISAQDIVATGGITTPIIYFDNALNNIWDNGDILTISGANSIVISAAQGAGVYTFTNTELDLGNDNLLTTGNINGVGISSSGATWILDTPTGAALQFSDAAPVGWSLTSPVVSGKTLSIFEDVSLNQDLRTTDSPTYVRNYLGLGTALLPSHTFTGDVNTGMWSSGGDIINLSTAGVERFEIDATSADFVVPLNVTGLLTINQTDDVNGIKINGFDTQDDHWLKLLVSANGDSVLEADKDWYFKRAGATKIWIGSTIYHYVDLVPRYDVTKYKYGNSGADGYLNFDGTDVQFVASAAHDFNFVDYTEVNTGTSKLVMSSTTAPASSIADSIILFAEDIATSSELRVRDEGGTVTTLSPHNFSLFTPDPSYEFPWSYYSRNAFLGKEINVDMYGAIREIERLSGKQFIYLNDIPKENSDTHNREAEIEKRMEQEIEICLEQAVEEVPVMTQVQTGIKYRFENGKVIEVPAYEEVATGEMEIQLKDGVRFDEDTGKFYRKRTKKEVDMSDYKSQELPQWLRVLIP